MYESYTIEVEKNIVEIFGDLTMEEAFDFLSFFDKKGFNRVIVGDQNSTLRMRKIDSEEEKSEFQKSIESNEKFYDEIMEDKNKEILKLKEQNKNLNDLIKKLINTKLKDNFEKEENENGHC